MFKQTFLKYLFFLFFFNTYFLLLMNTLKILMNPKKIVCAVTFNRYGFEQEETVDAGQCRTFFVLLRNRAPILTRRTRTSLLKLIRNKIVVFDYTIEKNNLKK